MNALDKKFNTQPILPRVLPFAVFLLLTSLQGEWGEASRYWVYLLKTVLGGALIVLTWRSVKEMRWAFSGEAIVVGIAVFAIWIGLEGLYPSLDHLMTLACPFLKKLGLEKWCAHSAIVKPPWNPRAQFGINSAAAWFYIAVRTFGSTLVVPPLEEVFYRSFLYRYIINPDFQKIAFATFNFSALLITAVLFGFSHYEWLAGIVCGVAYQGLVLHRNRLGDAITAHAITNLLLSLWVIYRNAWNFW